MSALGVFPGGNELMTGGSDAVLKRWTLSSSPVAVATLDLKGKLPLDIELALLPYSDQPLLVVGCTDRKVQVWVPSDNSFRRAVMLEGHEDWVRCLAFTTTGSDLLLASGSQDNYVRLWRIGLGREVDPLAELDAEESAEVSTKAHPFVVAGVRYAITLEALLVGHEGGLTNVHFLGDTALLSTAADNSMIIWEPTDQSGQKDGMWIPAHRFGAFGGRGLSFFGAVWAPNSVIATGWTGGVERWRRSAGAWDPTPGVTGHFDAARSVAWDPSGDYVLSTSADQTSRIHAAATSTGSPVWGEIARPQVHGYDLVDGGFLTPFRIATAAEEKTVRVFEGTEGFAQSLASLGIANPSTEVIESLPKGATVPPLGLSNRALGKAYDEPEIKTSHEAQHSVAATLAALPTEEELGTSTLWPEIEKIYGHGYELVTLAASHSGDVIATASRASSAEHAAVRLTSTKDWSHIATLPGHTLTVTRIAWSPDDQRVLTVSRDRGWRLYELDGDEWKQVAGEEKAHARMVLDCAFVDNETFVTASRDKTVKVWKNGTCTGTIKLESPATAVAAGPLLAIGTEAGAVELYDLQGEHKGSLPEEQRHAGPVARLAWSKGGKLASASEDRSVRVFEMA